MKAHEARTIASQNIKGPVIQKWLDRVYAAVREAASKGQSTIDYPLEGEWIERPAEIAIKRQLASDGYIIQDHENPDLGHPCSRAYTTISW